MPIPCSRHVPTRRAPWAVLAAFVVLSAALAARAAPEEAHVRWDMTVKVHPHGHRLEAEGRLHVEGRGGAGQTPLRVMLHANLDLEPADAAWQVTEEGRDEEGAVALRRWTIQPSSGVWPDVVEVPLRWSGEIHHPLESEGEEYARSFARTAGSISDEGVVLTRASWWVPQVEGAGELLTFRLEVVLPGGWDAVSQGARVEHVKTDEETRVAWDCPHPMEEVYLIANRFVEYDRPAGKVAAQAFLRSEDPALAAKYLEATAQYLEMYRQLIGPYPFAKFALVENFWETGYGMPSFTLLGPQVIRFPFILHSSYPHEILHNWWGNSVYVDWATGNWCEGLTAYQADHLIREGQGRGAEYRRDTLKKYRNYVSESRDFPLTEFRSRHSGATEAVGYGKALMVFHMLRRRLGDARFTKALQAFYRDNLWRNATWDDLARALSAAAGEDLGPWVRTWTTRAGAPVLALGTTSWEEGKLTLQLRQTQEEEPWPLSVPVALTLEGHTEAFVLDVPLVDRDVTRVLDLWARPVRIDVDPEFDVFRRLDLAETPPTLSEVFGAERVTLVVPAAGEDPLAPAWRAFAASWQEGGGGQVQIVAADEITSLPGDRAVWVLGTGNRWRQALDVPLAGYGAALGDDAIELGETRTPREDHGGVFVVRHPANAELALGWVATDVEASLPGLARKLPHYGKYSYLAFAGSEPQNVAKGEWPARGSPLVRLELDADGRAPARGSLPAREPLARLAPVFDPQVLLGHVRALADPAMEGRGAGSAGLDKAADYVADAFRRAGLEPGGDDGTYFQTFEAPDGPEGKPVRLRNVVAVLRGTDDALASSSVVLGAHYDHLGLGWPDVRAGNAGMLHPGADDNASGVSVLLEVARLLASSGHRPQRTLVFAAFAGEEWGLKGSRHYVESASRWPAAKALAMVNLDTVGRLGDQKLLVLGCASATEWRHVAMGIGWTTGVESTCVPDDPHGSDQVAFREAGVPAIQLFSGPHPDYHRPSDTVDKVDADGLVKVATWVREALVYLGERPTPLTRPQDAGTAPPASGASGEARRVSLGTMPAFDYRGPGVKVQEVLEGSPAERAGIRPGDLVVAIDGQAIEDLRGYSQALKTHAPGDVLKIRLRRGEEELEVEATLVAR